jgi:hypothetical protein
MSYPTKTELEALTKVELEDLALDYGIPDVDTGMLKADMISAMLAWFKDNPEELPADATVLDAPSFKPVDPEGLDIKSQFKLEMQVINHAGRPNELRQLSVIPPEGWGGGQKE